MAGERDSCRFSEVACIETFDSRVQVVRNNYVAGVAAGNPGACGTINATNTMTTDLVVEGNTFDCPPGNDFPGHGVNVFATHSVVQIPGNSATKR